jgi:repressor LexA
MSPDTGQAPELTACYSTVQMNSMTGLTHRQEEILEFIQRAQGSSGQTPTLREIAAHFGFRSMTAAAEHVRALKQKGYLQGPARRARSLQVTSPFHPVRQPIVDIPIFGAIPAGFAQDKRQESKGCVSVDVHTLGIKPNARTFALEVKGDSMVGRHILDGDYVILEHGMTPNPGDVVAALIDNESTLKTYVLDKGKPCLRAENPRYPKLHPAEELVIQGVMIALVRKRSGSLSR